MRFPVTDKFLWEIYKFLEKATDIFEAMFPPIPTMKEAICPELRRLKRWYEKQRTKRTFTQFINYLKRKGYIKIKNLEATQGVLLTKNGLKKVLKIKFKLKHKKKRKDGKWIMIIFDIPEKQRALRHFLRDFLYSLGFQMLQKSVWISPFDVLKELEDFIRIYSLDPYIKIFLIEEIDMTSF